MRCFESGLGCFETGFGILGCFESGLGIFGCFGILGCFKSGLGIFWRFESGFEISIGILWDYYVNIWRLGLEYFKIVSGIF